MDFQKNRGLDSSFSIVNLSITFQPLGVLQSAEGQKHTHTQTCRLQWGVLPMGSHDLIECIIIAFPCHLLCSLGGSLPLVCHLEPSVQSVLSFIQALPHMTLSTPSSSSVSPFSSAFLPSGGPGRPFNSPETLDVLPQGQASMFSARVRLPLQHAAQRVRHAWPNGARHYILRHLRPGVVSVVKISG